MTTGRFRDVTLDRYIDGIPCHKIVALREYTNTWGTRLWEGLTACGTFKKGAGSCRRDGASSYVRAASWCRECTAANGARVWHR